MADALRLTTIRGRSRERQTCNGVGAKWQHGKRPRFSRNSGKIRFPRPDRYQVGLTMFSQIFFQQFTPFLYFWEAITPIGDPIHNSKNSLVSTSFEFPVLSPKGFTIETTQIVNLTVLGKNPPLQCFSCSLGHTNMYHRGHISSVEPVWCLCTSIL